MGENRNMNTASKQKLSHISHNHVLRISQNRNSQFHKCQFSHVILFKIPESTG